MDYTGTLLIASPHLEDPNFRMTVILLAHQTDKEVLGLVLNRASDRTVSDFWESVFNEPCRCSEPLFIGGPMVGPVMGLHLSDEFNHFKPSEGLSLAIEKEEVRQLAENEAGPFRVFLGHAGWSTEQLAGEIGDGVWHLLPADEEDLFEAPEELWLRTLQKSARASLQHLTRLSSLPENPGNN